MTARKNINKKRPPKAAYLGTRIFMVVVAALFLMAFAGATIALENPYTLKGEVVAVDRYAKTLTVKPIEPNEAFTGHEYTFSTSDVTKVDMCTMNKSLRDIGVGEKVTLTYHETDGKLFADAIDIDVPTLAFACYDQ